MSERQRSEVARFRECLELEEQSFRLGLSGFAISATHESINARMERGAERVFRLIAQGRHEEAIALMKTDNWNIEGSERPTRVPLPAKLEKGRHDEQV